MSSRIGKTGWLLTYVVAGTIDVIQWLIDLTGIGIAFNEVADPFIGILFIIYFQLRGVSMITRIGRLASLLGATALEEISLSVPPAWILDVWYIHRSVRQEEAEEKAQKQQILLNGQRDEPLNFNGIRQPRKEGDDETPNIIQFPEDDAQSSDTDDMRKVA